MSLSRPVEGIKNDGKDIWFQNESFSMKDKMRIWFYKKFLEIQLKKTEDKKESPDEFKLPQIRSQTQIVSGTYTFPNSTLNSPRAKEYHVYDPNHT